MKKSLPLSLSVLVLLIFGKNDEQVFGNTNDTPTPLEEVFTEGGYKSVEDASAEFEQHFNQALKLPLRVPPISFTHHFGRFNNLDGEINDTLEIEFINDQLPNHHFKIDIRPIKHKILFEEYQSKVLKLESGSNAIYIEDLIIGFNLLVFEKESWQYVFSIDKDVSDKVTPEILLQIANSIDF